MAGHRRTEQSVLANHFDQKQSPNMFVIHQIFLLKHLKKVIDFYLFFIFLMILKAYRTKAVIRSERGQMGSIFRPPHAEC